MDQKRSEEEREQIEEMGSLESGNRMNRKTGLNY